MRCSKARRALQKVEFSRANKISEWLSEQVNSGGALNGGDRERAARGSSTEGGSDPETVWKCSLPGPVGGEQTPEAPTQVHLETRLSYFSRSLCGDALLSHTCA